MRQIHRVVVHHSASPRSTTAAQIRQFHMHVKHWRDIGYHFVIEGDGRVVHGRPVWEVGAHARGSNRDSIGVCIVGDNTVYKHRWNARQRRAAEALLGSLRQVFPGVQVVGHRDVVNTQCPGVEVRDVFPWVRRA